MGKKIVLSEAQFKTYMRKMLNENIGYGDTASNSYNFYANKLMKFANIAKWMGEQYANIYSTVLSLIKNMGITINGVQEYEDDYSGEMGLKISIDINTIPYDKDNYGDNEDGTPYQLCKYDYEDIIEDELYYVTMPRYFEKRLEVSLDGNILTVTPKPSEDFSIERIKELIPDI